MFFSIPMSKKISSKSFQLLEMFTNCIRVKVVKFDKQDNRAVMVTVYNKMAVQLLSLSNFISRYILYSVDHTIIYSNLKIA